MEFGPRNSPLPTIKGPAFIMLAILLVQSAALASPVARFDADAVQPWVGTWQVLTGGAGGVGEEETVDMGHQVLKIRDDSTSPGSWYSRYAEITQAQETEAWTHGWTVRCLMRPEDSGTAGPSFSPFFGIRFFDWFYQVQFDVLSGGGVQAKFLADPHDLVGVTVDVPGSHPRYMDCRLVGDPVTHTVSFQVDGQELGTVSGASHTFPTHGLMFGVSTSDAVGVGYYREVGLWIGEITGVADQEAPLPRPVLHTAVPNPFNPSTTLSFEMAEAGPARMQIHDAAGRLVATLADGHRAVGRHDVVWNGRDATGRMTPAGVYLCRLIAAGRSESVSMTLVK